jgi:hypothetical protein
MQILGGFMLIIGFLMCKSCFENPEYPDFYDENDIIVRFIIGVCFIGGGIALCLN